MATAEFPFTLEVCLFLCAVCSVSASVCVGVRLIIYVCPQLFFIKLIVVKSWFREDETSITGTQTEGNPYKHPYTHTQTVAHSRYADYTRKQEDAIDTYT